MSGGGDDMLAIAALAFALGLRHGLDADHIAAIDGLTRFNSAARPRLARRAGVLFSLGHGGMVTTVAALAWAVPAATTVPAWFGAVGITVSTCILVALSPLNLAAAMGVRGQSPPAPSRRLTSSSARRTRSRSESARIPHFSAAARRPASASNRRR